MNTLYNWPLKSRDWRGGGTFAGIRSKSVADVRSQPYSARFFQFNRPALKLALRANGLQYVFSGTRVGRTP